MADLNARPAAMKAARRAEKRAAEVAEEKATTASAQRTMKIVVGIMAVLFIGAGVLTLLPDGSVKEVPVHDTAAVQKVMLSGEPHFVLCAADAANKHVSTIFKTAAAHLSSEGVTSVVIDCDGVLPSGKTVAQRFLAPSGVNMHSRPTWVYVADGAKPRQVGPNFSSGSKLADAVAKLVGGDLKVRAIGNTLDLQRCVKDRAGGCVIALTTRPHADVSAELAAAGKAHRTASFVTLPASKLRIMSREGAQDGVQAVLAAAVRNAREAAAASGTGQRGELLIHLRRSAGGVLLVSTGYVAVPGSITQRDVSALLSSSDRAAAVLKPASASSSAAGAGAGDASSDSSGSDTSSSGSGSGSAAGSAGVDLADQLLERDERLAELGAAVTSLESLYIGRAPPPKRKAPSAAAGGKGKGKGKAGSAGSAADADDDDADEDGSAGDADADDTMARVARRVARTQARKAAAAAEAERERRAAAARSSEGADGSAQPQDGEEGGVSTEDDATRAARRRAEMEREAAESGFVAHLAEGEDEADGDSGRAGSDADAEADAFADAAAAEVAAGEDGEEDGEVHRLDDGYEEL